MPPKKAASGNAVSTSATKSKAAAKVTPTATSTADGVKRGRGRPRKDTAPTSEDNGKLKTTAKSTAAAKPAKEPKKPVGRPRKQNATSQAPGTGANTSRKRKATSEAPDAEANSARKRRATTEVPGAETNTGRKRKATTAPVGRPAKQARLLPKINDAPSQKLDVYVCGEGSSGELGLGVSKKAIDVKRPRLNPNLSAHTVGVVQIAAGGMHVVALTHDNQILTWGVNDQGALGRDTTWDGGLKDMDDPDEAADADGDDEKSDTESDTEMNPRESTPGLVDPSAFPEGTRFVQVAAGDSTSFALTDTGLVYGWGTFRSNEGIFGFTKRIVIQKTPLHVPELKNIKHIACGSNHVLALDAAGNVFAWGSGQQNQLGRRVIERTKAEGLVPREFGLPKRQITYVECGDYHSFAVDKTGNVWAWGLNSYGETGITENAGGDEAIVLKPQKVESLSQYKMKHIKGGSHHSVGVTEEGDCLVWGRVDGFQMGIKIDKLPEEHVILDERGKPRILTVPTKVPIPATTFATCGSDHTIAITRDGQAYTWGFSANYQTGQGTDVDVEEATLLNNTAVRGKNLVWAGAGGQYSIFAGVAEDQEMVNGVE